MTNQAPIALRGRNPDVLSCIANLSNDEVFTPPELRAACWTPWPKRGRRIMAARTCGPTQG